MKPTLLLIDGLNFFRPVYEVNPTPDPAEKSAKVISNLISSYLRALRTHEPTHVAWVFEQRAHTWRHALFPAYKIDRPEPDPHMLQTVAAFRAELNAMSVANLEYSDLEADDVVACLAVRARRAGINVIVLSSDKDLAWLLCEGVKLYNHFNDSWRDEAWCRRKLYVTPELVPAALALTGDSTDGIPGVPKVGAKTAGRLLKEHGSIRAILAAAEAGAIKGVVGANLRAAHRDLLIYEQLTTLKIDCVEGPLRLGGFRLGATAPVEN